MATTHLRHEAWARMLQGAVGPTPPHPNANDMQVEGQYDPGVSKVRHHHKFYGAVLGGDVVASYPHSEYKRAER